MLDGYKFPVYTTDFCPKNEIEWKKRSSAFNCPKKTSYACLPNDDITILLEFCYPLENIAIHEGELPVCLVTFVINLLLVNLHCNKYV